MSASKVATSMPSIPADLGQQRGRSLPVAGVARPHLDAEHQLGGLVDDDVELVAVKTAGRRLPPVAHLGVRVRDHPVGGHPLADSGAVLGGFHVLEHHLGQQPGRLGHLGVGP